MTATMTLMVSPSSSTLYNARRSPTLSS
jgi:hypothetical protein